MTASDIRLLTEQLTSRDVDILRMLRTHRLASTTQIQRCHFPPRDDAFTNRSTALRIAQRVLRRLEGHKLIARLYQRIGGVRRGSDSTIWQLTATGDRFLSAITGDRRRRYIEPSYAFVVHTVTVTELAVRLAEAHQAGELDHIDITPEPANWHRFVGKHGRTETLKPDLQAITAIGEFEDHWYLECDRATEHPGVVVRKAQIYERFAATGAYQAQHEVFPAVLWVVPDQSRQIALERALRAAQGLTPGIHRVTTNDDFVQAVLAGTTPIEPTLTKGESQ